MNTKQILGHRIKELRNTKNITQEKLAELINVESASISNIECGRNYPNLANLEKILIVLGYDFKDVFNFNHIKEKTSIKNKLIEYINQAEEKELSFLYKIITSLKEFKL